VDGRVQRERAVIDERQQHDGREQLGQRRKVEQGVRGHRDLLGGRQLAPAGFRVAKRMPDRILGHGLAIPEHERHGPWACRVRPTGEPRLEDGSDRMAWVTRCMEHRYAVSRAHVNS